MAHLIEGISVHMEGHLCDGRAGINEAIRPGRGYTGHQHRGDGWENGDLHGKGEPGQGAGCRKNVLTDEVAQLRPTPLVTSTQGT
jgi:hypothetical protein